jgi:spermidine synthase
MFAVFIHWSVKDRKIGYGLLAAVTVLSWFASQISRSADVIWSPYQKLVVRPSTPAEIGVYQMTVNNSSYQEIIDLSEDYVAAHSKDYPEDLRGLSQYDLPLLLHSNPETFLVVGSGTGNDVAGALRHNVSSVTAVEIDPAIISVGRELHPEKPYSSPQVHIVNDDARSYFASTDQKFDVIAFGLLDSHTTTSLTNARLDHYVYTKESIAQAKSKLKEGGIVVLNFYAQRVFIADRMERLIEEVFGESPLVFVIEPSRYGRGGVMFVAGDLKRVQAQLEQNPRLGAYIQRMQQTYPLRLENKTRVITDDWPYLYLESARIPLLYYLLIGLMILVFLRSNKKWESRIELAHLNRPFWHFFFLGAAFLLLEVQNISKASVVLGNTWQINAVIISGVLAMALLANWIAYKFPNLPLAGIYMLLVGTCVGLYFVDLARFGFLPYPTKAVIVGTLTSLPMLFSGIVFVRSFAITADKSTALGANLIGALIGALLQSMTFVTGIKALLIIVAAFYLFSLFTLPLSESKERTITEFAK